MHGDAKERTSSYDIVTLSVIFAKVLQTLKCSGDFLYLI